MDYKFKENLQNILKKDNRFYKKESKHFFKNKITECALNLDDALIKLLLGNRDCRKKFFRIYKRNNKEITVFDKDTFTYWINHYEFLPDSYTKFKQNIGLSIDGNDLFRKNRDVSLIFPYKDCVLQGGQTKEDAKRDEVFYNEVLAPDRIDRLLDKKVLTNFKRIDQNGEHKVNETDLKNITEKNLIIKGNNLLALHSLKRLYGGKVKLIYIDPPYNTGGEANIFTYNNSFNHSTWLTFMKNRLEVAKEFLRDDGFIAIAIDHYELFYLGCLADEVFGRDNRLGIITVVHNRGGRQDDKFFSTANEFMLVYSLSKERATLKNFELSEDKKSEYDKIDSKGRYKLVGFQRTGSNSNKKDRPNLFFSIYYNSNSDKFSLEEKKGYKEILPIDKEGNEKCWRWGKNKIINNFDDLSFRLVNGRSTIYLKSRLDQHPGEKAKTIWDKPIYSGASGTNLLKKLLGKNIFSYPKSLYTVLDTLKITTDKNDIIMDFHAGSGTTGHAVLELNKEDGGNRKFILIEQLDEHIAVCQERMQKVIQKHIKEEKEKPSTLIKEENTKSLKELERENFITFELAEYNQKFIRKIKEAKNTQTLLTVHEEMNKNGFLSYQFCDKTFKEKINDFENLALKEQKHILIKLLDKNMLYLNYNEIEDKIYNVYKKTIKLNKQIYERTKNQRAMQIELYQRDEPQINADERKLSYTKGMNHR
ncbi:hypothetical protein COTS27_00914 [Spirochaetota bacterium]|nr:hypothetical protein COTS27_00914 [Spirochaetota bacterium]